MIPTKDPAVERIQKKNNFLSGCTNNSFVRRYVLKKYDDTCSHCGQPIARGEFDVFPIRPDHYCVSTKTEQIKCSGRNKYFVGPNCARCREENPGAFEDCVARLRPVHPRCRALIDAGEEFGERKKHP